MKTVYKVAASRNGSASINIFMSYKEAARFVKFLLDADRCEVRVYKEKRDKDWRP